MLGGRATFRKANPMPSPHNPANQHVVIVLKTNAGGFWIRSQIVALLERGARVTLIIPPGPGRLRARVKDLDIEVLDSPFSFSFRPNLTNAKGLWKLRKLIASLRPTAVFYHLYASALASRLSTFGLRIPRIHMVAGPLYLESKLIARVEGFLRALDTALISGSDYTYRAYEELTGPRPKHHTVIPYGVDTSVFLPSQEPQEAVRERLGIDADAFVAVVVAYTYAPKEMLGQRIGVKGHEILLEAWQEFVEQHDGPTELIIVGSGFDEAGEQHRQYLMAQEYPNVRWFNTVEDVQPYYHAADVSVSPSISENHGAALEAGACGCPQIVSQAGGLPETVTNASGWVYPTLEVEALTACLREASAQRRSGELKDKSKAARELMEERFDARQCAHKVADVIAEAQRKR